MAGKFGGGGLGNPSSGGSATDWWDNFVSGVEDWWNWMNTDSTGTVHDPWQDIQQTLGISPGGTPFDPGSIGQEHRPPAQVGPTPINPWDLLGISPEDWKKLSGGGRGGSGGGGGAADGYLTPDGHFIKNGSPEDRFYRMADSVWTKVYGQHPPFAIVRTFAQMGVENTSQLDTIAREMPSHILGPDGKPLTVGQYDDMKSVAQQLSDKYFGRPIPDSLFQQWAKQGMLSPAAIEGWFINHPSKDIPKEQYGAIFDSALDWTKKWGTVPHPDQVNMFYQQLQQQPAA